MVLERRLKNSGLSSIGEAAAESVNNARQIDLQFGSTITSKSVTMLSVIAEYTWALACVFVNRLCESRKKLDLEAVNPGG